MRGIGDASYAIYLVHYPFLMFLTPKVYMLSLKTSAPLMFPILTMIVSAVIVGCVVHVWIEKPLLVWLGRSFSANRDLKHGMVVKII